MRQPFSAPAQYKLRQRAYIAPSPGAPARMQEAGTVITYDGRPGPHMEPLDEMAKDAYRMANPQAGSLNPTLRMPLNGGFSEAHAMQLQREGLLNPDTIRANEAEAENARLRAEIEALRSASAPPAPPPPAKAAKAAPPPPPA